MQVMPENFCKTNKPAGFSTFSQGKKDENWNTVLPREPKLPDKVVVRKKKKKVNLASRHLTHS